MIGAQVAFPDVEPFLGQDHDRATLRGLVSQRGQLGCFGHILLGMAPDRIKVGRHPVAQGDGAGLVQQQGLDVAGRLDGPAAHGQDVALHQAVHAGDADGRQQGADGGRNQADQQRDQDDHRHRAARVLAVRLEDHDHGQEDDGQDGQQDGEGDFVGGLLPVGPFHQTDHAVQEGVAALGGDADHDAVREDFGAAGDSGAVSSRLPDDRGRLAGDG